MDKSILTAGELSGIIAALKGIGSVSEHSRIERTLDKLHAGSNAVVSICEPVVIDLASHYKDKFKNKIEIIKCAILESRIIRFDYYSEKGKSRRRIEPYVVIFKYGVRLKITAAKSAQILVILLVGSVAPDAPQI